MANGDFTITEEQADGSFKKITIPASGKAMLTAADAAAQQALLGIGAAPYNAGATVTGNIALDFANGSSQKLTLTGSTLARSITPAPTNGTEGAWLTVRVKSDATGSYARTLNLHALIVVPTDSGLTLPKALTVGKTYILKFYYNGTAWELVSLVGGY
jgi:hypothetical protein